MMKKKATSAGSGLARQKPRQTGRRPSTGGPQSHPGTEVEHFDHGRGTPTGSPDEHGDTPHGDTPHDDTPHDDTPDHEDHGDGHIDVHVDAAHEDGYWDTVYNDTGRDGPDHIDFHSDKAHFDGHSDSGPETEEGPWGPLPMSRSANEFLARLEVALERHEDRLVSRLEALLRALRRGD
jgi:hypothetical protein